jgi:integrase
MRAGELKNLVATDVRLDGPSPVVSIRTLKGRKKESPSAVKRWCSRRVPRISESGRLRCLLDGFAQELPTKGLQERAGRKRQANPADPSACAPALGCVVAGQRRGVSLKTAQRMLGHRTIKTTSRYVRDDEEKARLALKRLESVG